MPVSIFLTAIRVLFFAVTFLCSVALCAQKKILWDKPGSFLIVNNGIYLGGADINGKVYSYTKTESDHHYNNLVSLITIFRKIPLLAQIRGFDGIAVLENTGHNPKFDYPIPCRLKFLFQTWYEDNGKSIKWIYEPPQWVLTINQTSYYAPTSSFNVTTWDPYGSNNPLYNKVKAEKATLELRELFWAPGQKETLAPGLDRYNDQYIVYNPKRPPYWLPVTIREVFQLYRDYYQQATDTSMATTMLKALQNEYEEFTEDELDGYAYAKGGESIFRIGKRQDDLKPVMRANPNYWDRNLPTSSIQFMVMEIPDGDDLAKNMNKELENNDGFYFVHKMLSELDPKTIVVAINK